MATQIAYRDNEISTASWSTFGHSLGSYLGLDVRATANASKVPADTLQFVFSEFYELVLKCFDMSPPRQEIEAAFHKSELIAVAVENGTLVGLSMGCLCAVPGASRRALYISANLTAPSVRRLGVSSRLTYAMGEVGYPELVRGIFGMWGQSILVVVRTQDFRVYRLFRKAFAGVAKIGVRPLPEQQADIDAVAAVFGWSLDRDNIHREVYCQRLSRHLVPLLGERDAAVLAGKYTWRLHVAILILLATVYPIRHMLGSRHSRVKDHSPA
ncbi:MAG: hypothetical protein FJ130_07185 [Deltaproteobacteria bacterium]|nr:hypothetical protein [Deltaproteobacteria bacterium]